MKLSVKDKAKADVLLKEYHAADGHFEAEHGDCVISGQWNEEYYELKMSKLVMGLVKKVEDLEEKVYGKASKPKEVEAPPVSKTPAKKGLFSK